MVQLLDPAASSMTAHEICLYAMHPSLLTTTNSSVFFTGINSQPDKYFNMHFQQCLCVCCAPASTCDLLERAKLGRGCTYAPALCSSAPAPLRSSSGSRGGWGPTTETFCNTSCCVGSLGVASGSDLLSCLLEYNCSLLIFFFLSL